MVRALVVIAVMLAIAVPAAAGSLKRDEVAREDHAMGHALANLPSGDEGLTIGVGVGTFEGQNALAVGASLGDGPLSLTIHAVTTDDGNAGAGAGLSWKIGK